MSYELKFYDEFIQHHISAYHPSETIEDNGFENLVFYLSHETAEARQRMKEIFSECKSPAELQVYVTNHQQALVEQADRLMEHITQDNLLEPYDIPNEPTVNNLARHLFNSINEYIGFLADQFPGQFNLENKMPVLRQVAMINKMTVSIALLRKRMKAAGVSTELTDIALCPLDAYVNGDKCRLISYRKYNYFDEHLNELERLFPAGKKPINPEQTITDQLFYINFNTKEFIGHMTAGFRKELTETEATKNQYLALSRMHARIHNAEERTDIRLWNARGSVKELLLKWISEETRLIKDVMAMQPEPDLSKGPGEDLQEYQMTLGKSVAVFACMWKLMVETGVAVPRRMTELFRMMSMVFVTNKGTRFTEDTFKSRYNGPDDSAWEATEDVLHEIFAVIEKYKPLKSYEIRSNGKWLKGRR
jgi:hypothetical protein